MISGRSVAGMRPAADAGPTRARVGKCAAAKRLFALDFDGVICDSCGESSMSAFKAATVQWPEIFSTAEAEARKPELLEKMRAVRPVVETGYENVVQIRCLYEGMGVQEMLDGWSSILPAHMKTWELERAKLVQLFGKVRDDWIAADLAGWLAPNRIYEGVAAPVAAALAQEELYIVTTKPAAYTEILMREMAGVPLPADRIFSQVVSGRPKGEVLTMLAARHPDASSCIFVEDKYHTLEKVCADPSLSAWQLYLVDWGYNTEVERHAAAQNPRINVISVQQFKQLLTSENH